jgi:hypothetical protein
MILPAGKSRAVAVLTWISAAALLIIAELKTKHQRGEVTAKCGFSGV